MKLLVTGAAGMLGLDVTAAAVAAGHDTESLTRAQLDIADREAVLEAVKAARPDAIINCAAYTNVDAAESDPDAAAAVNAAGTGYLAQAAAEAGAWIVTVSTDYVFDGFKVTGPYVETDPTGPRSVYGATKLLGEREVALTAPGAHTIVRSSWLFGAGGPCFPATMLRLAAERDTLSVVDDQVGCPTYTGHLASALVTLATSPAARIEGVVHIAAQGQCSWFEFASEIVRSAGLEATVTPCTTDEFPRPARRPAYSVLRSVRPGAPVLPDWHTGLAEYLQQTSRVAA
jgi:dTDP-4-dehydrorhamnose reductase